MTDSITPEHKHNFAPSELLYVAETTMPAPCDLPWYIHEDGTIERESWTQSGFMQWNPEDNDTQFKALVVWCIDNEITMHKGVSCLFDDERPNYPRLAPKVGIESYHAYSNYSDVLSGRVEAFTLVDAMIAAVLAHRGDSDG